jgi:hypothetical protein
MKKRKVLILVFCFCTLACCSIFLSGCKTTIKNEHDFLAWLNNPDNGVLKARRVNGFDVRVKFLPASYLFYHDVIQEEKNLSTKEEDSLLSIYEHSLTFIMTIKPDRDDSNNTSVMYYGVKTYKDYERRNLLMNFDFKEFVHIEADGKRYKPVLSAMENSYELGPGRNIIFVFVPPNKTDQSLFTSDVLDFVYDDNTFDMGLNQFLFKQKDIQGIPNFPMTVAN